MSNPFAFLPLAIAAADARVSQLSASALVAAGVTLLQRCAPLVRQLTYNSAAVLLPRGAALVTALAACDGHAALVVDAALPEAERDAQLSLAPCSVLFTLRELCAHVPVGAMAVWLDDVPLTAVVETSGEGRRVDLGSHVGLTLEGERGGAGSDEVAVRVAQGGQLVELSHAALLRGEGPEWLAPWIVSLLAGDRLT